MKALPATPIPIPMCITRPTAGRGSRHPGFGGGAPILTLGFAVPLASDGIVVSLELEAMVGVDTAEMDGAATAWAAAIVAALVMVVGIVGLPVFALAAPIAAARLVDRVAALAVAIIWVVDFAAVRVAARAVVSGATAASAAGTAADTAADIANYPV